jgi:hypothetical protein
LATVDDVARSALAAVNTDAGILRAVRWTTERLRELNNKIRLRSLRQVGEVVIPAEISTGTATATRGSRNVTGNAAAQAVWIPDLENRYIRFTSRNQWYRIAGVVKTSATVGELRLESEFADDDVTAGSYRIVQRFVKLDPRVRHLGKFVFMRMRRELETISLTELNIDQPDRIFRTAAGPNFVVEMGTDDDGRRIVEMYPYPKETEVIHYIYWPEIADLMPGDKLPPGLDPYILKAGVLVDVMRYTMGRELQAGNVESAAVWRNEYRAQETTWRNAIMDAQRADKGLDDITLILRSPTFGFSNAPFMNSNAHTEILIRGDRP